MGISERIEAKLDAILSILQNQNSRLDIIEKLQEEWVTTKEAEKLTGLVGKTLMKYAKLDTYPIKIKAHGNKNLYERKSLIDYNKTRTMRKRLDPESIRDQFLKGSK